MYRIALLLGLAAALLTAGCQNKPAEHTPQAETQTLSDMTPLEQKEGMPVKWFYRAERLEGNLFKITFKAKIDAGWYTYSMFLDNADGPQPTTFEFDAEKIAKVESSEEAGQKIEGYDDLFEMNIIKYKDEVTFIHKVSVKNPAEPLTGYFSYMACDNEKCLPPTVVDFSIALPK